MARGVLPATEIIEGVLIMLGGTLLLTPGFVTDAIGFVFLIPQLRGQLAKYIIEHRLIQMAPPFQRGSKPDNDVLEGEFRKED
jgi:UPF0716 protein FxsA